MGSRGLIDGRRQKRRYKFEQIKGDIFYIWAKNPLAKDREILEGLQPRLSSLCMSLDLKTLKRFTREAGIDEARSRLRIEESLRGVAASDNGQDDTGKADGNEKKDVSVSYCRYAGQMLSVAQLYRMNFPQMVKELPSPAPEDCIYSIQKVGHLLYFLYASGGRRLYDLDSLDHRGFGSLIGTQDNLRCSGMNKRVARMAKPEAIEVFQKKGLAFRVGVINRKDLELCYCDSHVIEVWVNKLIPMARHGTKNKQVKAINVHYLIGSDTATPLAKEYTSAICHCINKGT
jgi:hypothetical protein